ncbi:MAG: hypothetical protein EOP06_04955 [Proteobacteria bacterium]|nr:MAG: hypothetical protein EOP06_04955 [Pseudomonadota bacterium]
MNVIITMAGRGSRFRDVGYTVPKYEIIAKGRSLFDWSMSSLMPILNPASKIIFVTLAGNASESFIRTECERLGFVNIQVIEINEVTDGQATTAMIGLAGCEPSKPLAIYNIDTHIKPNAWNSAMIPSAAAGWVLCFDAPGQHWSFAKVGTDKWATEFAEKIRISSHATVGLYLFANPAVFEKAYAETYFVATGAPALKERYVAPMYNAIIRSGLKVGVSDIPFGSVIPLGTPEELSRFLKSE